MTPIDEYLANNFNIIEISEFGKVRNTNMSYNSIEQQGQLDVMPYPGV